MPEYETLERDEIQKKDEIEKENLEKNQEDEHTQAALPRGRKPSEEKQHIVQREILSDVLAQQRRLVILGDPGSGKSTLLRYLMLTLAQCHISGSELFQLTTDLQNMIPLIIPLSSYAEAWLSHEIEERSLKDFLSKHLHYVYLDTFTKLLEQLLEQGKLFVLLDGLDEIPDASLRMQVVRQIEIFTQSYPQNRFIVTSRIVGYKDASLAAEYQAYTLADFDEEQIKTFTKKWCPAYERWVNRVEDESASSRCSYERGGKSFSSHASQ